MGQFASFASSNPQLMQMGGQMAGGMMGGKGKGGAADEGLAPKKSSGGMQDMAQSMDQLGGAFNNMADAEFAATEEYRKQREQGMPEGNEPKLQDVDSPDSKLSGIKSDLDMESPDMDTTPVETDSEPVQLDLPSTDPVEEEDESMVAKRNALKGLMA
jgi:hypothetical protein